MFCKFLKIIENSNKKLNRQNTCHENLWQHYLPRLLTKSSHLTPNFPMFASYKAREKQQHWFIIHACVRISSRTIIYFIFFLYNLFPKSSRVPLNLIIRRVTRFLFRHRCCFHAPKGFCSKLAPNTFGMCICRKL